MRTLKAILCIALVVCLLPISAFAQQRVKETDVIVWDGYAWTGLAKGQLANGAYSKFFDFDEYSNATTGVAIASTLYHYAYWRAGARVASGTSKIIAGICTTGAIVLDTAHAAQNDAAELVYAQPETLSTTNGIYMAWRWKDTSVANTNHLIEMGLTDNNAGNDSAIFRITNGAIACVYENGNGGEVSATLTETAGIATWYVYKIVEDSNRNLRWYINNKLVHTVLATSASTGMKAAMSTVGPTFFVKVTDVGHAATKTLNIDYVRLIMPR